MRMSELIEQTKAKQIEDKHLARALAVTGPIRHEGAIYSGGPTPTGHVLNVTRGKTVPGTVRLSTEVDVPEGSYPGIDAELDSLRGKLVALKAMSSRALDLVDRALDKPSGKAGISGLIHALRTIDEVIDEKIDGIESVKTTLRDAASAAIEASSILAEHDTDGPSPDR